MMNIRWLALTALLSLSPIPALADAPGLEGVYRGTLGTQEIVLEIGSVEGSGGETYDGRYFYRRHGVAIPLAIERQGDGSLYLKEIRDREPTGAEWRLSIAGDKATGEFCKCDVSEPTASAKPRAAISLTALGAAGSGAQDELYRRELLDFPLTPGAEIRVDEHIAYVMERDPRFGAALPRLTRFPDAAAMAKVNDDLRRALSDLRLEAAECLFGAQTASPGAAYWQQSYRVALLDRDVLSIGGWVGHECGDSAYPNDTIGSLIYNLRTGERFDFERNAAEFFRSPSPDYDARMGESLPTLVALYEKHRGKPTGICKDASLDIDVRGRMYFAKDGLVIDPHDSVAHAYAGCVGARTIPYSEIRDLVRADSPFYSLVSR